MPNNTCPKCGANTEYWSEEARRFAANADYWRARAERAEALAEYRLQAIEARDRAAQYFEPRSETGYCWYCNTDADEDCAPNCPTVTHPKEGRP
jgi:hypothetical protein